MMIYFSDAYMWHQPSMNENLFGDTSEIRDIYAKFSYKFTCFVNCMTGVRSVSNHNNGRQVTHI